MEEASETVVDGPVTAPAGAADGDPPPLRVGRFFIFRRLGEGGMGQVLLGYDEELSRKLAIKLWRAKGEAEEERARMRREAQALARLSHPNVVQVYEVGEHRGQLYLAMEYVEGQTLREWVRESTRPTALIVERYVQAGRGLAAAHRAGILHRDFKPDNAMVGDDGRVRVLDFGLARADSSSMSEETASRDLDLGLPLKTDSLGAPVTRVGSLLGTPAYMPPEQLSRETTDARADVYSFCVSLWEALHGVRPYTGKTPLELLQAIQERRPREGEGRAIPGWLRAALLRGLAPEVDERWPTMAALVATLEGGARRRRWRIGAALGIAAGALVVAGVGYSRADLARRVAACEARGQAIGEAWGDAQRAAVRAGLVASGHAHAPATADRVEAILDRYAKTWSYAQVESCQHATIDGSWAPATVAAADACLDELRWSLSGLVEVLAEVDPGAATRAVEAASGLAPADLCVDPEALARRPRLPDDAATREQAAAIQRELTRALSLASTGRFADGRRLSEGLVERADALAWPPLAARARFVAGSLGTSSHHDADGTERLLEDAFFRAIDAGDDPLAVRAATRLVDLTGPGLMRVADAARWARMARALLGRLGPERQLLEAHLECSEANVTKLRGDARGSSAAHERCYAARVAALGPEHPLAADALVSHAAVVRVLQEDARARDLLGRGLQTLEPALGEDHPAIARSLAELGAVLADLGDYAAADAALQRALALDRRNYGPESPRVANDLLRLGRLELARGEVEASRRVLREAIDLFEKAPPLTRALIVAALSELAAADRAAGDLDAALEHLKEAYAIFEGHVGGQHGGLAPALVEIADVHIARGEPELAAPLVERARALLAGASDSDPDPEFANALLILGDIARAQGDAALAAADYARALAIREAAFSAEHRGLVRPLLRLGELELEAGAIDAARAHLTRSRALAERPGPAGDRGAARFALARALAAAGEDAEARALAELALADDGGLDEARRGEVRRWLKKR